MCAATTADRGFTWSDEETGLLLQLWGGNDAQSELTGNKRNFVVYERISETMSNMGFIRTASQCREKIKRMKREYTLTKLWNGKSKGTKKNMRFFEQFEKILLEKQSRNQTSGSPSTACSNNGEFESKAEDADLRKEVVCGPVRSDRKQRKIALRSVNAKPKNSFKTPEKEDAGNPWTPDVVLVEDDTPSVTQLENQSSTSTSSTNGDLGDKKRTSSRISLFKCMMDSLTLKFMKYQADSDAKLLSKIEELDNERTAMDERIQKMWLEFEEKRRADEREHEINIMTTFQGIMNQLKVNQEPK